MANNLYRLETIGTFENPKINGTVMLYCDGGIAFVKMSPVKITARPKTNNCNVPQGRWTWNNLHNDDFQTLVCSNCFSADGANEMYNYCPSCGAKMRNGVN